MPDPINGEDLLRNVPPGHFDEHAEEPTPAAVWPRPEDEGQLSTDPRRNFGALRSPTDSGPRSWNANLVGSSCSRPDELVQQWEVSTVPNPMVKGVDDAKGDNPAHALSDFRHLTEGSKDERRKAREAILQLALQRGWAYGPVIH